MLIIASVKQCEESFYFLSSVSIPWRLPFRPRLTSVPYIVARAVDCHDLPIIESCCSCVLPLRFVVCVVFSCVVSLCSCGDTLQQSFCCTCPAAHHVGVTVSYRLQPAVQTCRVDLGVDVIALSSAPLTRSCLATTALCLSPYIITIVSVDWLAFERS